jgi:RNA polymerase sigma-70 factor, ECF subfamily
MNVQALQEQTGAANSLSDELVIERVRAGDVASFEIIMRRYNQRLYRTARAILGDDSEAEDVVQEAYVRAYTHLEQFAGRARFSTWLTSIAVHEALARVRQRTRFVETEGRMAEFASAGHGPEQAAADRELAAVLERVVEGLPESFRTVFMLREIEGLSTADTAACLEIPEETVKTRLHRARGLLRKALYARAGDTIGALFPFGAARCDRMVAAVLSRITQLRSH